MFVVSFSYRLFKYGIDIWFDILLICGIVLDYKIRFLGYFC